MKGIWRLLGTVIGVTVALLMLALFVQDRWQYLAGMLVWLSICSWMMTGHRNWYVWVLAGFMVPLMGYYSQGNPGQAFEDVMLRLQQTGLGVISYTLVASFVFPRHAANRFVENVVAEIDDIRWRVGQLSQNFGNKTPDPLNEPERLKRQAHTLQSRLQKADALDAAAFENVAILQDRARWLLLLDEMRSLSDGLTRWRLGFADLGDIAEAELPKVQSVTTEIERRLENAAALLRDETQAYQVIPVEVTLPPHLPADPFQQGAIRLSLQTLHDLETAAANALIAAADIKNLVKNPIPTRHDLTGLPNSILPDPDRLLAMARIVCAFTAAFLLVIFVPEMPSPGMVVVLICSSGLIVTRQPQTPVQPVYLVGIFAVIASGVLHIFVMPKLAGFYGLALMLFVYAFMIGYVFHQPAQIIPRFFGVGFFTIIMQLDDTHQTYSFTYVLNFAIAFSFPILILHFMTRFPVSFLPERVFERKFRRYMSSAIALIDDYEAHFAHKRTWWQRQKHQYHLRQLMRLPGLMEPWIAGLPADITRGDKDKILHDLLDALDALAHRVSHFAQSNLGPDHGTMTEMITPELRAWRVRVKETAQELMNEPLAVNADILTQRLTDRIDRLRDATNSAIAKSGRNIADPTVLDHVGELAVFRGVSRALLNIVRPAQDINWARLRETRF